MPINVGQALLHDAKQGSPQRRGKLIKLTVHPQLASNTRTISKAVDVLLQTMPQMWSAQCRRVHQIAERSQFLHRFLERSFNAVPILVT